MSTARIELPPKLIPVFSGTADTRGAYGGRGSGKTRSFAKMAAVRAHVWAQGGREGIILCGRQYMNSLEDSSLEEIKAAIASEEWLAPHYDVGDKYIRTADRRVSFSFTGLDRNIDSIKSKARILLAWVDEAEPVTEEGWVKLIPTLREVDSELWVTWNPERRGSPTDKRFRNSKDPLTKIVELNYRDNPWFTPGCRLDRTRLKDLDERPEQYAHIWDGDYATFKEGAYYAASLTRAQNEGRIGFFAYDPLMPLRAFFDIGGTGQKADATSIWIAQFIDQEIRILDYYEAVRQPLGTHIAWMRQKGYTPDTTTIWLPHDGEQGDKVFAVSYESHLSDAGYDVEIVPNHGKSAAMERVRAAQRLFPRMRFHAETTEPGRVALGWYHEKIDEGRNIGLGPEHDWCLAAGTQILTPDGWRDVEGIAVDDLVVTPVGARRVLRSGVVRNTDEWTEVRGIRCTPEHRFFTSRGLVEAGELSSADELWTRGTLGLTILAFLSATLCFGLKTAITSATPEGNQSAGGIRSSFIAWSTRLCMAACRRATKSITSMATRTITRLPIWRPSRSLSIEAATSPSLGSSAFAGSVARNLAATRNSARGAATSASGPIGRGRSGSVEPAYNLTVDVDECYFVRGDDGRAYLVSNSSHAADAFGMMAVVYEEAPTKPKALPQIGETAWAV